MINWRLNTKIQDWWIVNQWQIQDFTIINKERHVTGINLCQTILVAIFYLGMNVLLHEWFIPACFLPQPQYLSLLTKCFSTTICFLLLVGDLEYQLFVLQWKWKIIPPSLPPSLLCLCLLYIIFYAIVYA